MSFDLMEERIVQALAGTERFRSVSAYGRQSAEDMERLAMRMPAALVFYESSDFTPMACGAQFEERATFTVAIATATRGADSTARRGTSTHEGAYGLITLVLETLTGRDFGLDAHPLAPAGVRLVQIGSGALAYGVSFTSRFDRGFNQ